MPITREEATALAELICAVRPQWNTRGVLSKGLAPLAKHPAPLPVIAWAAIRAAQDPDNRTPAVIPLNGPHWNLSDQPKPPRLTPDLECPQHLGQWAGNCRSCAVDGISHPGDPVLTHDDHDHRDARTRARETAAHARRALGGPDTPEDPVTERLNQLDPATTHERHPERAGMTPDERRHAAARDARPNPGVPSTGQPVQTPTEGPTP